VAKADQILNFFSLLNSERSCGEAGIKTKPPLKSVAVATLPCKN